MKFADLSVESRVSILMLGVQTAVDSTLYEMATKLGLKHLLDDNARQSSVALTIDQMFSMFPDDDITWLYENYPNFRPTYEYFLQSPYITVDYKPEDVLEEHPTPALAPVASPLTVRQLDKDQILVFMCVVATTALAELAATYYRQLDWSKDGDVPDEDRPTLEAMHQLRVALDSITNGEGADIIQEAHSHTSDDCPAMVFMTMYSEITETDPDINTMH